jgi:TPR repeat protein
MEIFRKSPQQGIVELRVLAEKGSLLSMLELGRAYALGIGTSADPVEAERWFRQVTKIGSARAHHRLGRLYLRLKRYDDAKRAFDFAAARNYTPSVHDLGKMYFLGLGVEKNLDKARRYLEQAATGGSVFGKRLLARLLMEDASSFQTRVRGFWLFCGALLDLVVVLCTEGPKSARLIE